MQNHNTGNANAKKLHITYVRSKLKQLGVIDGAVFMRVGANTNKYALKNEQNKYSWS